MKSRKLVVLGFVGAVLLGVVAIGAGAASEKGQTASLSQQQARLALVGAQPDWATRTVWACDRRKMVIVDGVRAGEKIPPERAQLVADVLMDLMRYCDQEITAKIGVDQKITVAANGKVYEHYVVGGDLPVVPATFGQPTKRELQIWKAELDKLVAEGDRLFHSDELGSNGVACAMCHPHAANTHPETYPKFQTQLKKVALLRDMVNWCIINPLEGKELAHDDARMKALEAYMLAQRAGKALEAGKH